jgi:hypothetical protein
MTWAFETIGTASKSNVASVLPAGDAWLEQGANVVLGKRRQEAGCRPAFLVGLRRKRGPSQLDARQAQFAQQKFNARGVNGVGRRHATTSRLEVGSTA